MDSYLVALAPPCTNANLHMGHLAGVYIPGDIIARYYHLQQCHVITVSGADQNNTYTELKAKERNMTFEDTQEWYGAKVFESLDLAKVRCDAYVLTSSEDHKNTVNEVIDLLLRKNAVLEKTVKQPYCNHCKEFIADSDVVGICACCGYNCDGGICENCNSPIFNYKLFNARHVKCSNKAKFHETQALVLNLKDMRSHIIRSIMKGQWDDRCKLKSLEYLSREAVEDIIITSTYKRGIEVDSIGLKANSVEIWFEAIWSLLTALKTVFQKDLEAVITHCNDNKCRLIPFMGQDSEFYYAIALSCVMVALGFEEIPFQLSVQRFIKLSEKKFSSSRGHVIFLDDLAKKYPIDTIRFYSLSVIKPYCHNNNNFSPEGLESVHQKIECFKQVILNMQHANHSCHETIDDTLIKKLHHYHLSMKRLDFNSVFNALSTDMDIILSKGRHVPNQLEVSCLLYMMAPIMPDTFNVQQTSFLRSCWGVFSSKSLNVFKSEAVI